MVFHCGLYLALYNSSMYFIASAAACCVGNCSTVLSPLSFIVIVFASSSLCLHRGQFLGLSVLVSHSYWHLLHFILCYPPLIVYNNNY